MKKKGNKLAIQMAVALVLGLIAGGGFMFLRETLNANGNAETWQTINKILFQDITVEGAESAIGVFYIPKTSTFLTPSIASTYWWSVFFWFSMLKLPTLLSSVESRI